MRLFLFGAAALVAVSSAALAADDIMAGFYGNTVISSGGMLESHTHYRADHTFSVTATAMGQSFNGKGTWAIDDKGQLCRTYETPPPGMPNPLCIPAESHKVGDSWTVSVNGRTRNMSLKAGIE
jgi:opacity protein-like surface antigen